MPLLRMVEIPDPIKMHAERAPGWSCAYTSGAVRTVKLESGAFHSVPLWEMIQPVDIQALYELAKHELFPLERLLGRYRTDFADPLAVRNWVTRFTRYVPDLEQYGVVEHWPDPDQVLGSAADDCDGMGILTASILYSFGCEVFLTLGHLGTDTPDGVANHVWVTWFPPDGGPARVLETTGDDQVDHLPTYEELAVYNYIPRVMTKRLPMSQWADPAVPEGRIYLCDELADRFEETVARDKAKG